MTVFALGYGTKTLGYDKEQFLLLQMAGVAVTPKRCPRA